MNVLLRLGLIVVLGFSASCAADESAARLAEDDAMPADASAVPPDASTVLDSIETMCADAAPAMQERQQASSLFDRLGGEDGIHAVIEETVRLHLENEEIRHIFAGIDSGNLVELATQFLVAGTGGPNEYTGRDMATSHAHLGLTDSDFLSAERDIEQAMRTTGHADDEVQEVACAFVSFRGDVVTR